MQKDSDKPLGPEKHLIAGTVAGKELHCTCILQLFFNKLIKNYKAALQ